MQKSLILVLLYCCDSRAKFYINILIKTYNNYYSRDVVMILRPQWKITGNHGFYNILLRLLIFWSSCSAAGCPGQRRAAQGHPKTFKTDLQPHQNCPYFRTQEWTGYRFWYLAKPVSLHAAPTLPSHRDCSNALSRRLHAAPILMQLPCRLHAAPTSPPRRPSAATPPPCRLHTAATQP